MIKPEIMEKLSNAITRLDGNDRRTLREEFFEPAAKECHYSEPEVEIFADPSLGNIFDILAELVSD